MIRNAPRRIGKTNSSSCSELDVHVGRSPVRVGALTTADIAYPLGGAVIGAGGAAIWTMKYGVWGPLGISLVGVAAAAGALVGYGVDLLVSPSS